MIDEHGTISYDFAYLTECQLATLEDLKAIKRTPLSKIVRQERIVEWAVEACRIHKVKREDVRRCPRLKALLGFKD